MLGLPQNVSACLFDLDGVLTDTASVHTLAWTRMFDDYLRQRAGVDFTPFDPVADYLTYIDGKKRDDGVRSFLTSRGISVPDDTVHQLGNRKNDLFTQTMHTDGITVFDGSRRYLRAVSEAGLAVAVVSSSANTREVLELTGLAGFIGVRVDGVTMRDENIPGKPAPDSFLRAARLLDTTPSDAAVFEDAVAGVQAGRAGGFFVVGVDRHHRGEALRDNGADIVVNDLSELVQGATP